MPADSFSGSLGVILMGTGNDNNSWGTNANNFVFQVFEDAIANQLLIGTTGGTVDLSGSPPPLAASQARYAQIQLTGVLTANVTLIVPNLPKVYQLFNNTTGGFVAQVYPSGNAANATNIPQGCWRTYYCDGANNIIRGDKELIGSYVHHAVTSGTLNGHLRCQGQSVAVADYPDLFAAIGFTYGSNSPLNTLFKLPQLEDTGRYLRTATGALVAGTTQANAVGPHIHPISDPSHSHVVSDPGHSHAVSDPGHAHGISPTAAQFLTNNNFLLGGGALASQVGGGAGTTQNHVANISLFGAVTGITLFGAFTGISVLANSGTESRPETMIAYTYIRY